jgi:hypothetical protein
LRFQRTNLLEGARDTINRANAPATLSFISSNHAVSHRCRHTIGDQGVKVLEKMAQMRYQGVTGGRVAMEIKVKDKARSKKEGILRV